MRRALVALILVLFIPSARADDDADALYDQAVAAIDQAKLEEGLALLDRAWRAGDNGPGRAREIIIAAGDAAATIGDTAAAARWFSLLAAIDPAAKLPAGTSPKVTEIFDAARTRLAGRRIDADVGEHFRIRIADPLGIAVAVRARPQGATWADPIAVEDGSAELPFEGRTDLRVLDASGNALIETTVVLSRQRPRTSPAPVGPAKEERSWIARWQPWAIAGGALAVTAGVFAVVSLDARSDLDALHRESGMHEASEALSVETRMQRAAIAAQLLGVAAVAAGVTSIVLWRSEASSGVALEGRF